MRNHTPIQQPFILLRILLFACLLCTASVPDTQAQEQTIRVIGQVLDETGEPVIGAAVYAPESPYDSYNYQTVVHTDVDGYFSLDVPHQTETLRISYIGFESVDLPVRAGAPMKIVLKEKREDFGGTPHYILPVPYGRDPIERRVFSGIRSVYPYPAYEIQPHPLRAVEGEIPGVRMMPADHSLLTWQPIVRGLHSLSSAAPLYVVDGIAQPADPSGGLPAHISDKDIRTISVLRDADATSFYGAQGAGGVILIGTRDGYQDAGKSQVNFSARGGYTGKPGTEEIPVRDVFSQQYTVGITYHPQNDWNAKRFPHVRLSLDYLDAPSVAKGEELQRYSARLNMDKKPTWRLSYGLSSSASLIENGNRKGKQIFVSPYLRVRLPYHLYLNTRAGWQHYKPMEGSVPAFYPHQRNTWTVSNLISYGDYTRIGYSNKATPWYSRGFTPDFTLMGGHEIRWLYGNRLHSFPMRGKLDYQRAWTLTVNLRPEGYQTAAGTHWGTFGSVGLRHDLLSWFALWSSDRWLDRLDLRASYGTSGNLSPWTADRWERTGKLNVGLDLTVNRKEGIRFSFDYYKHTTRDLLVPGTDAAGAEVYLQTDPDAKLGNKGVEFALFVPLLCNSWPQEEWTVSLNASHNTGKLYSYADIAAEQLSAMLTGWESYYDPNWYGSMIHRYKRNQFECLLQCDYALGGRSLVNQEGMEYTGGNSFTIRKLRVVYRIDKWTHDRYFFVEGNSLYTFGRKQIYPQAIYPGRNVTAGIEWRF